MDYKKAIDELERVYNDYGKELNALDEYSRTHFEKLRNLVLISEMFELPHEILSLRSWNYYKIDEERSIGFFCENGCRISWSDDGTQPKDEWLYIISFSNGPYFFGREYLSEHFNSFFNDLKSYDPAFIDTRNHCLYFRGEESKAIHKDYKIITDKYRDTYSAATKLAKIKQLKRELDKLEEQ